MRVGFMKVARFQFYFYKLYLTILSPSLLLDDVATDITIHYTVYRRVATKGTS
jgi:hypothetical protein